MTRLMDIAPTGADFGVVMAAEAFMRRDDEGSAVSEKTTDEKVTGTFQGFLSLLKGMFEFIFSSPPTLASKSVAIESPTRTPDTDNEVFRPDGQDNAPPPTYPGPVIAKKNKSDISEQEEPKCSFFKLFGKARPAPVMESEKDFMTPAMYNEGVIGNAHDDGL